MQNSIQSEDEHTLNCSSRRVIALLIDYAAYYIIYVLMIIAFYVNKFGGVPEVSTDALFNSVFSEVIQTPAFSLMFLGVVLIWEIIIPLINNGQSISKKIVKIRINTLNNKKISLVWRGIIKLIILNPYGIVAYLIGSSINKSYINVISNILSVIFIISVIMFFKNKESLHDRIAKTFVSASI
ncbi:MAG: RDD family protein [Clostridium sp.]